MWSVQKGFVVGLSAIPPEYIILTHPSIFTNTIGDEHGRSSGRGIGYISRDMGMARGL
jgi:hypothetical protein